MNQWAETYKEPTSKTDDIMLKYYFDKRESLSYEYYLSKNLQVSVNNVLKY